MNQNISNIKKFVEDECKMFGFVPEWFFEEHLVLVEKNVLWLMDKIENVNKEVILLGVWLHDTQRIRGLKIDHQEGGAEEAKKIMKKFGYKKEIIDKVQKIILTHSCNNKMPNSVEGEILATADAMAYYTGDFFLRIATLGDRNLEDYKKWAMEKLNRNYNEKIAFDFAKEKIKERHDVIIKFLNP